MLWSVIIGLFNDSTPSLSDTTVAQSPSTLGNFLYRNRFRSSAMMNPFLPQDQSPRLGFWAAWFSELSLQGQLLGQAPVAQLSEHSVTASSRLLGRSVMASVQWWCHPARGLLSQSQKYHLWFSSCFKQWFSPRGWGGSNFGPSATFSNIWKRFVSHHSLGRVMPLASSR